MTYGNLIISLLVLTFPLVLTLLAPATSICAADESDIARLIQEVGPKADFVFRGTIRRLHTSTMQVEDVSHLAVVRLNEVVSGSGDIKNFLDKDITVSLLNPANVREGQERIFFAVPWQYGESIGVEELGSYITESKAAAKAAAESNIERAQMEKSDRKLKERIDKAPRIIVGRISNIKTTKRPIVSEHDPEWQEAIIEVTETIKGGSSDKVTILYPGSQDVMWYQVPKPQIGQDGVWLLESGLVGAAAPDQLGVADPADFLPRSELSRVKKLLER